MVLSIRHMPRGTLLDKERVKKERDEIVKRYDEWTAHNIHLQDGIYTYDQSHTDFNDRIAGYTRILRRVLQVASDLINLSIASA
jgi:hypothetical protein